jgi:hypothetical protein
MKKKNKPVFIPGFRRSVENGPAQQDSKMILIKEAREG